MQVHVADQHSHARSRNALRRKPYLGFRRFEVGCFPHPRSTVIGVAVGHGLTFWASCRLLPGRLTPDSIQHTLSVVTEVRVVLLRECDELRAIPVLILEFRCETAKVFEDK